MKSKKIQMYGLVLLPFIIVILLYELLPLVTIGINSFISSDTGSFTVSNYTEIFQKTLYQQAIVNSIKISIISAIVGMAVALIAANAYDSAGPKFQHFFTLVLNMTSNFTGVPLAFAYMLIMGNAGILTMIGQNAGIPWLADFDLYTGNGLLIVYIYFQIPMATLLLIPAFSGLKKEWKEAASLLQAAPIDYWFHVGIPVLLPSILGTLSVLFSNALAAYATAYALVTSNYALLPLQITNKFKGDVRIDKGAGGALSVILIILMLVATMINNYVTKKSAAGKGGNR